MAQRTRVELVDDLDGTEIADGKGQTISFAFQNVTYEVDLTDTNAAKLESALKPYMDAGRRISGGRGRPRGSRNSSTRDFDIQALRAWAKQAGVDVPKRGRIPQATVDQYHAAGH